MGADDTITIGEVKRIADLAHLHLEPDEAERMTRELGKILAFVKQLEEVDVTGVAPTAHVLLEGQALRADEPHAGLDRERALAEAPKTSQGGFAVPSFVDEG